VLCPSYPHTNFQVVEIIHKGMNTFANRQTCIQTLQSESRPYQNQSRDKIALTTLNEGSAMYQLHTHTPTSKYLRSGKRELTHLQTDKHSRQTPDHA
jgi:hypothetical protein